MRPPPLSLPLLALLLAACSGEGIRISGELDAGFPAADRVVALESGREAPVRDGRFDLDGLGASPVSLRLLQGSDTVARLDLPEVPPGAEIQLGRLRMDPGSRRAFPDALVGGGDFLVVNGIRIGASPADGESEVKGVVLAASDDGGALLLRPLDDLPDARVLLPESVVVATPDGEILEGWRTRAGDSLRVAGTVRDGILVASRVTLPPAPEYESPISTDPADARPDETAPAAPPARAPPAAAPDRRDDSRPSRGRGRGKGKGHRGRD